MSILLDVNSNIEPTKRQPIGAITQDLIKKLLGNLLFLNVFL